MKKRYFFIILFLFIVLAYVTNITQIPTNLILLNDEKIDIKTLFGIELKTQAEETIEAWQGQDIENQKIQVNLFGKIKVKEVSVTTLPQVKVVPIGKLIGLKLYTNGVLVIGMTELKNINNEIERAYEQTEIKEGDTILEVDNVEIDSIKTLQSVINESKGNDVQIKYARDGEILSSNIKPIQVSENEYKLGLWVRDSASGVGTISFYEPNSRRFAALGHGISDVDTGELLNIETGEIVTSNIVNITKGKKGIPGEIKGSISNGLLVGEVNENTNFGIFGDLDNEISLTTDKYQEGIEVAVRDEIQLGEATVLCTVEGNKTEEYNIEITQINYDNNTNNKSMQVKITDEELIEKTGGIICGMSGSPIIQNGKLIGVLTNVLVSDPQVGYAVFSDIMIKKMMR